MPRQESRHIRSTIGENIRRLRDDAGMTQRDLAVALEMDQVSMSRWETGRVMPRHENLERVAEVLGVDVGVFYVQFPVAA